MTVTQIDDNINIRLTRDEAIDLHAWMAKRVWREGLLNSALHEIPVPAMLVVELYLALSGKQAVQAEDYSKGTRKEVGK